MKLVREAIIEIKMGIDKFFCGDYIPIPKDLYTKYFNFRSKLKTNKELSIAINDSCIEITQRVSSYNFVTWYYPYQLRYRCLIRYFQGLEWIGKMLARNYKIDKISLNAGDIVIDCGANVGDLMLYLDGLNLNLNYFGFEPGKLEFKALKKNVSNNKFNLIPKVINKALGKNNEIKTFYYCPEEADSSLEKPVNYSSSYEVEVVKLDTFYNETLQGKKIKLLKLEAEGFEPEVLLGGRTLLKNTEYIAADLGPERGLTNECTVAEVTKILQDEGFSMLHFNHTYTAIFKNMLLV
ncbi:MULTISPECIES: FkbM family methyltransferase [Prochlorococcus]|uniref:SAM-dependent methyltransferase n=1 Tax=Prochlorococcus marinus (strain SARG / CCMP1375 / SS120) TaxID=167539 RepID=Q7VB23_PROMA|nr:MULTISPECIES: FkbM family methyltransferase [Prochlorococcus]AAQ00321.1 SAM-dependent methyltransferase [Prochlorococcus marinus subsp. marinus str. CCMP1375]KGG10177.1 SAM-dependent methyltransferase [Prochlorococcus marinus str. LG]KGG22229.1 SAM-dependent methyltransferase [Prochlorococcus marinus str. SS2]KGG24454.1 SAM-dependent methyltransferase [Prochlorococcus marinus str. SS35]KGG33349.1 SAM-dependent methyltransferase [Prochlorococcus marinus str. SS51]